MRKLGRDVVVLTIGIVLGSWSFLALYEMGVLATVGAVD